MADQSGKMSKGCLIALIVVGAVVVIGVIIGITCYVYREDLAKSAAGVMVNGIKEEVAKQAPEGVDTVQFNAIVDGFKDDLSKEKLDPEKYRDFMSSVQMIANRKTMTAAEVGQFEDAMIAYFPDLATLKKPVEPDTTMMPDSAAMQDTMSQ